MARHGNVGLMFILLEKHPLQDLRAGQWRIGKKRRILTKVVKDGARFGEVGAIFQFDQRNSSRRIARQEFGRSGFSGIEVELDTFKRNGKPGQEEANLVAIAGRKLVIKLDHGDIGYRARHTKER